MKFVFDNLGPIEHGDVELGNMTVFCGKNNTGKTYVSYLIYGFYYFLRHEVNVGELDCEISVEGKKISVDCDYIAENIKDIVQKMEERFIEFFPRIYNTDNAFFDKFSIKLGENLEGVTGDAILERVKDIAKGFGYSAHEEENNTVVLNIDDDRKDLTDIEKGSIICLVALLEILFNCNWSAVFMLPAERSGLNMFYRELNINRNDAFYGFMNGKNTKELEKKIAKYPLPISQYINLLNSLDGEEKKQKDSYNKLAATLEEKIVYGNFAISKNGTIQFLLSGGENIEFHLSSSTAKSLFGLDYLLKNELYKGCILIIDEPEQNLHPDNQRYIARLLCRLANAGIKVIISTHSDCIIREMNNLILLSNRFQGYEKLMKEYGYEEEELIAKEDVKGYIFKDNTIEKVIVDSEGMKMDVFDEVINKMKKHSFIVFKN